MFEKKPLRGNLAQTDDTRWLSPSSSVNEEDWSVPDLDDLSLMEPLTGQLVAIRPKTTQEIFLTQSPLEPAALEIPKSEWTASPENEERTEISVRPMADAKASFLTDVPRAYDVPMADEIPLTDTGSFATAGVPTFNLGNLEAHGMIGEIPLPTGVVPQVTGDAFFGFEEVAAEPPTAQSGRRLLQVDSIPLTETGSFASARGPSKVNLSALSHPEPHTTGNVQTKVPNPSGMLEESSREDILDAPTLKPQQAEALQSHKADTSVGAASAQEPSGRTPEKMPPDVARSGAEREPSVLASPPASAPAQGGPSRKAAAEGTSRRSLSIEELKAMAQAAAQRQRQEESLRKPPTGEAAHIADSAAWSADRSNLAMLILGIGLISVAFAILLTRGTPDYRNADVVPLQSSIMQGETNRVEGAEVPSAETYEALEQSEPEDEVPTVDGETR